MKPHPQQPRKPKKPKLDQQILNHPYVQKVTRVIIVILTSYFYYENGYFVYSKSYSMFMANHTELSKDEGRVLRYRDNTMLPLPAVTICFPMRGNANLETSNSIVDQFNKQLTDKYIKAYWYDQDMIMDDIPMSEVRYRRDYVQSWFTSHRRRPCVTIVLRQTRAKSHQDNSEQNSLRIFEDNRRIAHITLDSKVIGIIQGQKNDTNIDVYLHHNRERNFYQNSFSKSQVDMPTREELEADKRGQFFVYELAYKTSTTVRYDGWFYSTCNRYQRQDVDDNKIPHSYRECLDRCNQERHYDMRGRLPFWSILDSSDHRKIAPIPKPRKDHDSHLLDDNQEYDEASDKILKGCDKSCRASCYEVAYTARSLGYLDRIKGGDRLNKLKPKTFTLRITADVGQDTDSRQQRLCTGRNLAHDPFCEMQKYRTFTSPLIVSNRDAYQEYFVAAIGLGMVLLVVVGLCSSISFNKLLVRAAMAGYIVKTVGIMVYGTQNKLDQLSEYLLEGYIAALDVSMN